MSDAPSPNHLKRPNPVLTAEVVDLLRRHNLLVPLLRGMVEEGVAGGQTVTPEEHQQLMLQWAGEAGLEKALLHARQVGGLGAEDVAWQVERPLRLLRHAREQFGSKAEARFLERKSDLDLVTYSLVRLQDGNLARELYLQLLAGESSFPELAERYSEGPERQTRGVVGPKPISQAHPLLADKLRTALDGEVIQPFKAADWWLVVRRETYEPAVMNQSMADRMARELLDVWVAEEAQRQLHQLIPTDFTQPTAGLPTP